MTFRACAFVLALAAPLAAVPMTPVSAQDWRKYDLDTPIEVLLAHPAPKAVIDAYFPKITEHPMFDQIKGMSLRQLAPLSQGVLSGEVLAKVERDLAAIK
ncbi:hypothetical protein [Novosphingobium olei]|uniref:Uncharacterized protein n=1 Tax=Novosphingobium olei TaxID=2728851 RepID=A0A7Y0BQH4_9SPHN|nr:hypothetical protein [Novosphingobium olei]NML94669.1 hypothetical protein [Novosphingobium olei]